MSNSIHTGSSLTARTEDWFFKDSLLSTSIPRRLRRSMLETSSLPSSLSLSPPPLAHERPGGLNRFVRIRLCRTQRGDIGGIRG